MKTYFKHQKISDKMEKYASGIVQFEVGDPVNINFNFNFSNVFNPNISELHSEHFYLVIEYKNFLSALQILHNIFH